eukprot:636402-Pleurochrysis_carterae.AAC.1
MSTLRRSEAGPSSSTFQRLVRAVTKVSYRERGPSCVYNVNKSSTSHPMVSRCSTPSTRATLVKTQGSDLH